MTLQLQKKWLVILLIASLIFLMLLIIKHYNADKELNQQIYNHSEITDTV